MFATVCFFLLAILAVRSLVLMLAESKPIILRLLDFVVAIFFGAAALFLLIFLGLRFSENTWQLAGIFLLLALPVVLLLTQRLRRPYNAKPVLFLVKTIFTLVLLCASLITVMISGFLFLTEDQPILKIIMTGKGRPEGLEWKPPGSPLQKQDLMAHEVQFETPEGKPVAQLFVYGDQVAVKAKVLRFRPVLNAMGLRNLCRIEYVHNGYTTAQRFNSYPHSAQEIHMTDPRLETIQSRFWKYWEGLYYQEEKNWWVKSATLESGYFPLIYANGTPFRGAYLLTVTPGGLSGLPLP